VTATEQRLATGVLVIGRIEREAIPPIPDDIAAVMHDLSSDGQLVE
jgi:hypothetical protein